FYFAALYDAFFAESFFSSEVKRADINDLEKEINAISENVNFNSLWANLFFDHSGFYAKNAVFERELNRTNASDSLMITSFDLLILSKKIEDARFEVINYLNNTKFDGYVSEDIVDSGLGSKIEITYVQKPNVGIYISLLLLCVLILLLVFVVIGVKSSRNRGLRSISRAEKIDFLLNRLDKALSQKKISDAEYFFLKKNYDSEYSALKDFREERSIITLNLDESKSKLNALQKGLKDLKKHYSAGLIIPEDYAKNLADVNLQIIDIKNQIRIFEEKLYASRRNNFSRRFPKNNSNFDKKKDSNLGKKNDSEFNVKGTSSKTNKLSYSEFDVLGTGEKEKDEKLIEEKEKIARRKLLKKFKKNKKV
ncbi:MAG: hypothetical protein PHX27_04140, partial [Candidatus ainarchaeum sp.]|nr:hypothetical protein [Candidatus ainarchaeum sp.]